MRMRRRMQKQSAGFTLVELLVVLMIIGIAMAMVSLSLPGRDNESMAEDETEDFMVHARFVSEQTVLSQEVIGLFLEPRTAAGSTGQSWCYQWRRYQDQSWQAVTDFLSERCLPSELQVEVRVEGEEWQYDPQEDPQDPVLVFYPSGEATPFEMALIPGSFDEGETQRVEISMMGDLSWRNRDELEELNERDEQW